MYLAILFLFIAIVPNGSGVSGRQVWWALLNEMCYVCARSRICASLQHCMPGMIITAPSPSARAHVALFAYIAKPMAVVSNNQNKETRPISTAICPLCTMISLFLAHVSFSILLDRHIKITLYLTMSSISQRSHTQRTAAQCPLRSHSQRWLGPMDGSHTNCL